MTYVVYHKDTTRLAKRANGDQYFATEAAGKRHITRYLNSDYAVAELSYYEDNIEKTVERVNMMSGETYTESVNTPLCCSPASETYWSQ